MAVAVVSDAAEPAEVGACEATGGVDGGCRELPSQAIDVHVEDRSSRNKHSTDSKRKHSQTAVTLPLVPINGEGDDGRSLSQRRRKCDNAALSSRCQSVRLFCQKNFLVLGMFMALLIGTLFPKPGTAIAQPRFLGLAVFQTLCVIGNFLISGLALKTDELKQALRAIQAAVFGVVSILFITCASTRAPDVFASLTPSQATSEHTPTLVQSPICQPRPCLEASLRAC
eukprot:3226687-Pleurochrysis_carterae.AAC.1